MWNVCCCCLIANRSSPPSLNIFSECLSVGQSKIYEAMINETLNIQFSFNDTVKSNILICDSCILKTKQACAFKKTVLQSQQMLTKFLESLQCNSNNKLDDILEEMIKTESNDNRSDISYDNDKTSLEDEIFIVRNQEPKMLIKCCSTDLSVTKQNQEISLQAVSYVKQVSMSKDEAKNSNNGGGNDCNKVIAHRGNGPILRENSLKVLKNSTVFAFQWYKSKYTCFCCQKSFSNMDKLRIHATKHTLKDIEKKIILQKNMLVKVEVSVLNCKLCCKPLEDLEKLREHLQVDHNFDFQLKEDLLVPFKIQGDTLECQICSEKFTMFRLLNIHMNKHFQKQVCHVCGATFSNLKFLNLHKSRLHRRLNCKECNVEFLSKIEKRNHDFTVHKIKSAKKFRFPCPHCDERYYQERFRVLHLVEKHGMHRPEHKCSMCAKVFITKSLCNSHYKVVHKKERKHSCDICNHQFYTKSGVARHRVTHTGEKKFSCAICSGRFATKDSLRRHMKRTHAATF